MARHLTETGYETGRRAGRRTGRIVAIALIMALTVGGALVVRHLGGVLQSQLSASVSRLTAGRAPYVIHNMAQQQRENDYFAFKKHVTVTGTTVSTLRKCRRTCSRLGGDGRGGVGIAGFGSGYIS